MEEMASRCGGWLHIHWISISGEPTKGGPPIWGLDKGLTTPRYKRLVCCKVLHRFLDLAKLQYFRVTVITQNCIHKEISSRLHLRNVYYHSVQNILSSHLFSENSKIKIHKTVILPVFCIGMKLGLSHQGMKIGWGCLRMGCWGYNIWT
jgi:hypothetical protein